MRMRVEMEIIYISVFEHVKLSYQPLARAEKAVGHTSGGGGGGGGVFSPQSTVSAPF